MYERGELISSSYPFVHALSNDAKSNYCDNCCDANQSLKRCNGCRNMFYCTQKCQKFDWKWHKYECKTYSKHFHDLTMLDDIPLEFKFGILRLTLYLQNEPDKYFELKSLPKEPNKQ